jgi:NAD(P)H-nitrite reductase large subunit
MNEEEKKEYLIKQKLRVVCICKGINLGTVMQALEGCETVKDVNAKTGCGSGGCAGERCGPRIEKLLKRYKESK